MEITCVNQKEFTFSSRIKTPRERVATGSAHFNTWAASDILISLVVGFSLLECVKRVP